MEVINPIKHMSATLNYRKYVTTSLSTYPRLNHYNTTHILKGICVPLPLRTLAMLRRRHSRLVNVVTELVRPALTKGYQIRLQLVIICAEVGDLDLAYTIIEAVLLPSADLLSTNRRGSSSG